MGNLSENKHYSFKFFYKAPFITQLIIFVLPLNGNRPITNKYVITPIDHISAFFPSYP